MLQFHPKKGAILMCDFGSGFKAPEMIKCRPVIVISPKLVGREKLCTVVPLSTVKPEPLQGFHHKMSMNSMPSSLQEKECWAKCDMLYTVSFERLDRIKVRIEGKRRYIVGETTHEDLVAIQHGVMNGLGLNTFLR